MKELILRISRSDYCFCGYRIKKGLKRGIIWEIDMIGFCLHISEEIKNENVAINILIIGSSSFIIPFCLTG